MDQRGQSVGMVTGLIFGVATLVIAIIIAFVVTTTIGDAGLLDAKRTTTTVTNETGGFINETGYTLSEATQQYFVPGSASVTFAYNNSNGSLIDSSQYSVSSVGVITNATDLNFADVNFTYAWTEYSNEEQAELELSGNFSSGVDNVSEQVPTVLLIAAIVLIITLLAVMVSVWRRMKTPSEL